jgi:hypothetical protein
MVRSPLTRAVVLVGVLSGASPAVTGLAAQSATPDLKTNISHLADLDFTTRMNAARLVRRAPSREAVAALRAEVLGGGDEFVRYRALVLLTGFVDRGTPELMRRLISDPNDRVREVSFRWLADHPDPGLTTELLRSLETEQAEFVRPALVKALAAIGTDPLVRRALLGEAGRGLDFFRSAVIETLGESRAVWAVPTLTEISRVEGPLQDNAVLALGRIGDPQALPVVTALPSTPVEVGMAKQAARCLLGDDCPGRIALLTDAVTSRVATPETARAGVAALAAIATTSDPGLSALVSLLPNAAIHDDVVIGFGGVALRRPERMLKWLDAVPPDGRGVLVDALAESFERFEEDYAEEQFFATTRASYWAAAEGSPTRALMAMLIDKLDF